MEAKVCPVDGLATVDDSDLGEPVQAVVPGTVIADRYVVERRLGSGGMGAVFLAMQPSINRSVALKVLLGHLLADVTSLKRFYREARTASQLDHPNIVRIFDFGVDPATRVPFLAMEYVPGATLKEILKERDCLPEREACAILAQVAKALVEAHAKGVIHRDLKPENIMVRVLPDGESHAMVLDFGIAKLMKSDSDNMPTLTSQGEAVGTPTYMSPEQIRGEALDFRADLYALGCLLHRALSGHPPFYANERLAILYKQISEPPPPIPDRLADGRPPSQDLIALHESLLAKNRERRPPSTTVVARFLTALSRGEQPGTASLRPEGDIPDPPASEARTERLSPTLLRSLEPPQESLRVVYSPEAERKAVDLATRRGRRLPWWIPAAILAGIAGTTVGAFLLASGSPPEPEPVTPVVLDTGRIPDRMAVPEDAPAPDAGPASRPGVPPTHPRVTVRSDPEGADVIREDRVVGQTPFVIDGPDAAVRLRLRKAGFLETAITIEPGGPSERVARLVPAHSRPPRPAPAPPGPKPTPRPAVPVW
jgi:serine/threonine-protein kinase